MAKNVWHVFSRGGQLLIAISAIVIVAGGGGFGAWQTRVAHNERTELQKAVQERDKAAKRANELQSQLESCKSARKETANELETTVASLRAVTRDKESSAAALGFLEDTIFSGARPSTFWSGGPRQDTTLRAAVDDANASLAGEFPDAPLAEAWVRTELGHTYSSLGDQDTAIEQFRKALKLREDLLGVDADLTVVCRNDLARSLRAAGRIEEAGRLYERWKAQPRGGD